MDVVKHDGDLVLRADLPGIKPHGVKADDIEAKSEDGVLEVTIPMPREEEKQTIEVKTKPKSG